MSDRSAASVFSMVFRHLAANPTEQNILFAKEFSQRAEDFDFCKFELWCDEELMTLGLARRPTEEEERQGADYIYLF